MNFNFRAPLHNFVTVGLARTRTNFFLLLLNIYVLILYYNYLSQRIFRQNFSFVVNKNHIMPNQSIFLYKPFTKFNE